MEFFARERRTSDAAMLTLMAAAGSQIGQFIDRREAQQRVVESEMLNSAIVAAALDCVISIDADGRVIEFNPAAVATFGISREEALGRELADLIVPVRLRDQHRRALQRCVDTGESQILGTRLEMPARRSDGTEFPVELAIGRVQVAGRPIFTAHVRDITDRKRMERERTEILAREHDARIQAEEANRSKDQFLATLSHELRTPLTAIVGWAAMLRTMQFDTRKLADIYDSIFRNAQAQTQIVSDLLDVSRIVTGRLQLDLQPTDVRDVVRLGLETVRPTATAKGVLLNADIPSTACSVSADPARLQQVIWKTSCRTR
jgi:PAS domain S-box-containing protein